MKNHLVFSAMLVFALLASITAIRIEILNNQIGGFLPRPQPPSIEGNDIPWREGSRYTTERSFKMQVLAENGFEVSDEEIESLVLTESQQKELDQRITYMTLNSKLKRAVEGMGVLNHLLVPSGIFCGFWILKKKELYYRAGAVFCLLLLSMAGFLMLYRQYLPAVLD